MAGVVNRVIAPLSGRTTAGSAFVALDGRPFDIAIGGVLFSLANDADTPFVRRTSPIKKDQVDTEADPGEQSLTGWWLRSQATWDAGAGVLYQEPYTAYGNAAASDRFRDSQNVDVFTVGQIKLLKATTNVQAIATTTTKVAFGNDGTTDVIFVSDGVNLKRVTSAGSTTVTWGGTGTITSLAADASNYYAADNVGIYKGTLAGGAGTKLWNTGAATVVKWVKQRLVACVGPSVYELAGGTPPTLPATLYTHPSATWTWTAIAEGPNAIYTAGYQGATSAIVRFQLASAGTMPTLTSATTVAELPLGEQVHSLLAYLGTFLIIGTNKGVRVGTTASDGSVTYGPLTYTLPSGALPVKGLAGRDRFVWATASNAQPDGTSGLVRIDLGNEIENGVYSYANDLCAGTGSTGQIGGIGMLGDRLAFAIEGVGLYLEHATNLAATGWLRTGRIRFRTIEDKLFKAIRLRVDALKGAVSIEALTDTDTTAPVVSYSVQGVSDLEEASLPAVLGPQESLGLRFILTPTADKLSGPVIRSYQVKALPGAKRQRAFQLPLLCYDKERRPQGQNNGYIGFALERLQMLEALEEYGDVVLYQDFFSSDIPSGRLVVIDELIYTQTSPPAGCSGNGGVLIASLRTVT